MLLSGKKRTLYRVTIQKTDWTHEVAPVEELIKQHEIQSEDPYVVAQFLRAVADQLDLPKKIMRGH